MATSTSDPGAAVHELRPPLSTSSTDSCSISATLSIVSDRWTVLILRNVFRGVRRFGEMQGDLDIARNILSDRLAKLVANGVLEKVPYQERPTRYEYHLTAKGMDLSPALIALMGWGDRWYKGGEPPTILTHEACGEPIVQRLECPHCRTDVRPHQIRSQPGKTPGDVAGTHNKPIELTNPQDQS